MIKKYNSNLSKYIATAIVVLILVIYFIYHLIELYRSKTEAFSSSNQILLSKIDNNIKFGDILLFSANGKDMHLQFYNMSLFTHCGMIIKLGEQFYIMEANANRLYRKTDKIGYNTTLNKLEDRIQNYNGQVYLMKLNKELEPEMKIKVLELLKDKKYKYPYSFVDIVRLFFSSSNKYFHCYSMVNHILSNIDITEEKGIFEVCKYIINIKGRELKNGYKYKHYIHIIPDRIDLCRSKKNNDL